jgi:hypothetical protein
MSSASRVFTPAEIAALEAEKAKLRAQLAQATSVPSER